LTKKTSKKSPRPKQARKNALFRPVKISGPRAGPGKKGGSRKKKAGAEKMAGPRKKGGPRFRSPASKSRGPRKKLSFYAILTLWRNFSHILALLSKYAKILAIVIPDLFSAGDFFRPDRLPTVLFGCRPL
jgi:hypothetical protein